MTLKKRIIIFSVVAVLIVISSFAVESIYKNGAQSSGALIKVINGGKTAALMDMDVLTDLGSQQKQGKDPLLETVLTAAGVGSFSEVTVEGLEKDPIKVSKSNLNDKLVLIGSGHDTMNLVDTKSGKCLVKDVTNITVK